MSQGRLENCTSWRYWTCARIILVDHFHLNLETCFPCKFCEFNCDWIRFLTLVLWRYKNVVWFMLIYCSILRGNRFIGGISPQLKDLNVLSEQLIPEDISRSEQGCLARYVYFQFMVWTVIENVFVLVPLWEFENMQCCLTKFLGLLIWEKLCTDPDKGLV